MQLHTKDHRSRFCNVALSTSCINGFLTSSPVLLQTEKYLKKSGLEYTVVRPGGLKNDPESKVGNLILREEDTLRAKSSDPATSISRETVSLSQGRKSCSYLMLCSARFIRSTDRQTQTDRQICLSCFSHLFSLCSCLEQVLDDSAHIAFQSGFCLQG